MTLKLDKNSAEQIRALQSTDAQNMVEMALEIRADPATFFQFEDWSGLDLRSCDLDGVSFFGANLDKVTVYYDQLQQISSTNPKSFEKPTVLARLPEAKFHRPTVLSEGASSLFQPGFDLTNGAFGRTVDLKQVSEFEEKFSGVYELYQYFRGVVDEHSETSSNMVQRKSLKFLRAGFQIFPHEGDNSVPTFCLKSKIGNDLGQQKERLISGSVLLSGKQTFSWVSTLALSVKFFWHYRVIPVVLSRFLH